MHSDAVPPVDRSFKGGGMAEADIAEQDQKDVRCGFGRFRTLAATGWVSVWDRPIGPEKCVSAWVGKGSSRLRCCPTYAILQCGG